MGEIVNLHRVKQAKARAEAEVLAAANRMKHGRTGPAKAHDRRAEARRQALLDGVRRDPPDDDPA